jgi:hypothetical protein
VKVSELVNVSELSGGEQKVSGPKIRKYGQGHFQLSRIDGILLVRVESTVSHASESLVEAARSNKNQLFPSFHTASSSP